MGAYDLLFSVSSSSRSGSAASSPADQSHPPGPNSRAILETVEFGTEAAMSGSDHPRGANRRDNLRGCRAGCPPFQHRTKVNATIHPTRPDRFPMRFEACKQAEPSRGSW